MPIHDWTRVTDGTFHAFHTSWVASIQERLNELLPPPYYAQAEQIAGPLGPDVLTLQEVDFPSGGSNGHAKPRDLPTEGGVAIAEAAPRVKLVDEGEMNDYVLKRRTVVIRHTSGDRMVALLEIVSPGNKAARHAFETFVEKAVEALFRGYHLLIIDLFPPSPRDPEGIHSAIWHEFNDTAFALPKDLPLTLAAYSAGQRKRAYVEPTAVGRELIEMPLFLTEDRYVNVPLEETYRAAYRGVPRRWKAVLETDGTP
jgi:hypothetical protein